MIRLFLADGCLGIMFFLPLTLTSFDAKTEKNIHTKYKNHI